MLTFKQYLTEKENLSTSKRNNEPPQDIHKVLTKHGYLHENTNINKKENLIEHWYESPKKKRVMTVVEDPKSKKPPYWTHQDDSGEFGHGFGVHELKKHLTNLGRE